MVKGIMLQGTASDVGKSVLCTALCRILARKKLRVTPFKSQNMSNNSYVTMDGKEIGRAQGIQAEAACTPASVFMNPILLKPRSDKESEVIRLGVSYRNYGGRQYRNSFYETGLETIQMSLHKLSEQYDYVVIEGAGSPVEVNLNDKEIVNMKVAQLADVPVVLVADIDRGGVFASIVGTLSLLSEKDKERVIGIIINKFRGDERLFDSGKDWIENYTGIKVLGVVPFLHEIKIEGEDSLSMKEQFHQMNRDIDIAVIDLPYISNYTDLEPFRLETDVSIRFVRHANQLGQPDAVIIPGTKSTFHDLDFLKESQLAEAIRMYATNGGTLVGICGGYQMMGWTLCDVAGTDTGIVGKETEGLHIVPLKTEFEDKKTTVRSVGVLYHPIAETKTIEGFEIHLGRTYPLENNIDPFLLVDDKREGICLDNGRIIGTYFHHLFHNDAWRTNWLNRLRTSKQSPARTVQSMQEEKERSFERLADRVEAVLDIPYLMERMEGWKK